MLTHRDVFSTLRSRATDRGDAGTAARTRLDLDHVLGHAAPDRLTILVGAVLLLPAVLFLFGWARVWAMPAGAAGVAALALMPGWHAAWPLPARRTALCLSLGLVWAGATGAHHLLYSTADWQIRDAVLHDLSTGPWPVGYRQAGDGTEWLLRAPLGFFLPAGLVGQVAGLPVARAALTAWAGLGFALVLMLLAVLARDVAPGRPQRGQGAFAVFAGVFVLFGGMDLLPNLYLDARFGPGLFGAWGRGGEWWDRFFQYTGHVTATLWAPNHALPAWLLALLVLRHGARAAFLRGVAVPVAGAVFWSPIATAGAAVLIVLAALRQGWRGIGGALAAPANWLAVVVAVPVVLYLVAGSAEVPHGVLPIVHPPLESLGRWLLLVLVEVLPWAAAAAMLLRGWVLTGAAAMLLVLPAYVFGPGNEMTSRGGMAPLAVLAVVSAAALLAPAAGRARRAARVALLGCVVLAAGGAAMEGSLLVTKPAWPASDRCSLPEAAHDSVFDDSTDWAHYLIRGATPATLAWIRDPVRRTVLPEGRAPRCWPGGGP
ncbi:hypothetical protein ACE7GA_05545 [Roseomonas sp. CCTCC AB2023176]|uniref:hypothetical protein n=1 Tax=Roseomonas sp. CCTCC AB2023176 TaxID=3342640 RepID=UPI0035DC35B5